jgi:hypothetical protein
VKENDDRQRKTAQCVSALHVCTGEKGDILYFVFRPGQPASCATAK